MKPLVPFKNNLNEIQDKTYKGILDPDEFIKGKICKELKIDNNWLEETDPIKRFRQDLIKKINKRERNVHRSLTILRSFLINKKRDYVIDEVNDKDWKSPKENAYYEIHQKMHKLKGNLYTNNRESQTKRLKERKIKYPILGKGNLTTGIIPSKNSIKKTNFD